MSTIAERIADKVPEYGVRLAYGERTDIGGEPFVPVAFVAYGFGAGEGSSETGEVAVDAKVKVPAMTGSGGGGGGVAIPVGAYVRRGERVVFRPNTIALLVVGVPALTALAVGIAAVVRAAR